jgi:hypothetical protein
LQIVETLQIEVFGIQLPLAMSTARLAKRKPAKGKLHRIGSRARLCRQRIFARGQLRKLN